MGFLDYAWSVSLQKDKIKTRIIVDSTLQQPILEKNNAGFTVALPVPLILANDEKEKCISFLGDKFPADPTGKIEVGRLFRACIHHLTSHTLLKNSEYIWGSKTKPTTVETFSRTLLNDVYVNANIRKLHPEAIPDISFANTYVYSKMKPIERIFNPSTRIMTALISKVNMGILKGKLSSNEEKTVTKLTNKLDTLKQGIMESLYGEENEISKMLIETTDEVTKTLESYGPFLEAPSLKYTENIGPCTIYSHHSVPFELNEVQIFRESFKALSGTVPREDSMEACWGRESDAEAQQAFDTWFHQKDREKRILKKLEEYTSSTRLKSVEFPEEDYSQYMRARTLLRGGSRRLLDSLRVAQDALDEDPGKEYGQLDLNAIVQMLAAGKTRTDVFVRDEYLSRSFAWGILFDASASMKIKGNLGRALAICVAEATKELLMDPGSWTFFAFSDRFYVLKDTSEGYSHKVRARIGGLKFKGLTYMPDAIQVAGEILSKRFNEQRFLIVLSDGRPYGYPNISSALSKTINTLKKKDVIVIGVGLETERMGDFFKVSCSVNSQKDLIKKFAKIYVKTSTAALE